jgi:hypothetical protein
MSDPRSVREKIADALIPRHEGLLRVAYLAFGDDRVLLRFLTIPEYGGSQSERERERRGPEPLSPPEIGPPSADLLPFSRRHPH